MTRHSASAAILLVLAALDGSAGAQGEGPSSEAGIMIGVSRYNFSGAGTGPSLNAGLTIPLVRWVVFLEPSIGFLRYTTQFGNRSSWMFPELTVQAQHRLGILRPYLGAGLGAGTIGLSGPARWKFTLLGLGGVRVLLSGRWGVRGEVRLRSVDPWNGHTADFGIGFTRSSL